MNVFGQCMEIKSQPDVDEPQRYETPVFEKAMERTKVFHEAGKVNQSAFTALDCSTTLKKNLYPSYSNSEAQRESS